MIIGPVSGFVPRPYQEHCINGGDPRRGIGIMPAFARYKRVLAVMATGCHERGQLIMLADGSMRRVEDIAVGDLLMGPDSTPRTVLSLARGRQEMRRIIPETGPAWVVNLDHVLTLANGGDDLGLRDPSSWLDITVREYLREQRGEWHPLSLIRVTPTGRTLVPFWTEKMPEDDYFGFTLDGDHRYLLADGTVTHNCGKTELYLSVARRFIESPKTPPDKRVLILAHRDELVSQPIERSPRFGLSLAREQGRESGVGRIERVVASTIQSMEKRLGQYKPDEIGLVIIDEAHHSPSDGFGKVLEHFMHAFVLGVTATPERLDGVGLGEVFEACAFNYGIEEATEDGWLVPVMPKELTIEGLDISKMRARMGDLPPGPLGELLAEYAMPVAKHIVEHAGDRLTLVFCATVAHAHAQAEALRRYTGERVECLDGGTNKTIRADVLADFKAGKVRYLTNAALFLEGMDAPKTACVAIVRPSKSRGLVTQIVGRGTRALPGLVDAPALRHDAAGRRAAIAASAKPNVLVLDFCAQVEQLGLVSVADVLAGKLTPEERLALGKLDICGDKTIDELTQEARRVAAVEAAAAAALSEAEASVRDIDPFNPAAILSIRDMPRNNPSEARCSEKMAAYLIRQGIANAATLSVSQAKKLGGALGVRAQKHLSSYRQQVALQKAGVPPSFTSRMSYQTAGDLIAVLASNGWRRPAAWERDPRLGGRTPEEARA